MYITTKTHTKSVKTIKSESEYFMKKTTATKKNETKTTAKNETKTTAKNETKKVVRVEKATLIDLMKKLDNSIYERTTNNSDVAIEIFDTTSPRTRCGLWQRGEKGFRYDLYIGNETKYYNKAVTIAHQTYIDDKKMSKKEVAFLKKSYDEIVSIINSLTATETKTTTETKTATETKTTTKKTTTKKVNNKEVEKTA